MSLEIIVLAAGEGKRMKSNLPKVLHEIGGKPMLMRVIETAMQLNPKKIHVVCGVHTDTIQKGLQHYLTEESNSLIQWVYQDKPLGTGHAVKCVLPYLDPESSVLVLFGDVPLITVETLQRLEKETQSLGLLLVKRPDPFGFGRIVRDNSGKILAIVEEKDATPEQKEIQEIFPGTLLSSTEALNRWLPKLTAKNAQGEYYLTDIIHMAVLENLAVQSVYTENLSEVQGINNRKELIMLERIYQERLAQCWLLNGVNIMDPKRIDIRGEFQCGQDTLIDVNVVFEGNNKIGKNCIIEPNCVIKNSDLADNVTVHANSVLEGVCVAEYAEIGPFARLRPGSILGEYSKVGNFVEMKKTQLGARSKAGHLSYLGDAFIGEDVNIGAGTITCNYDGVNKHETIIEDGAFIGCGTELVAPISVGKKATIGAGTTLRRNAPAEQLTLSDVRQKVVSNWKRPRRSLD
jgi:bifunctional UDP-N-acetylglucosamine pyrophosphorylase / glucosamine-1-phosphate N-acetyltransferase